jgi:hypothetical protein
MKTCKKFFFNILIEEMCLWHRPMEGKNKKDHFNFLPCSQLLVLGHL